MNRMILREQIETSVGDYEVSSVHFYVHDDDGKLLFIADETCIFFAGDSEVVGNYDDHTAVVASLRFVVEAREV